MSTTHSKALSSFAAKTAFFLAGAAGIYRSADGTASTWKLIQGTAPSSAAWFHR
jgi:hypothetical protein